MIDENRYASVLQHLRSTAVDLSFIGSYWLAWPRVECIAVMHCLRDAALAIVGGDVCEVLNDRPSHTYDNWYAKNRPPNEQWAAYVQYCFDLSIKYVNKYREGKRKIIYAPVFVTEVWESECEDLIS